MNTFDHIRASALQGAGYIEPIEVGPLDLLRKSEWSPEFERLLRMYVQLPPEALIAAGLRYGTVHTSGKPTWSDEFIRLMRGCLLMGALRYGKLNAPGKILWDRVSAIDHRWEEYIRTGNKMYLVDIANFCLLEFEEGGGKVSDIRLIDIAARCMNRFISDTGNFEPTENTKKVEVQ
jgi:hypothetical protein